MKTQNKHIEKKEKLSLLNIIGYIIFYSAIVLSFVVLPILLWGWANVLLVCVIAAIVIYSFYTGFYKPPRGLVSLEDMAGLTDDD